MPARFHANEILDRIVSLYKTAFEPAQPTGLGLKTCTKGGVEFYLTSPTLTSDVPAIFVKPAPTTEIEVVTTPLGYEMRYRHRIVYVRKFTTTERVTHEMVADTIRIAELLIDYWELNALALTNGQIVRSQPVAIEWEPEEDLAVAAVNRELVATAILFDLWVKTRRT